MLAASARADTVADMRSAISQLRATKPIHASIEVQRSRKNEGRFANQQFTGAASLDVVEDEAGRGLTFAPGIVVGGGAPARADPPRPREKRPRRGARNDTPP